MHQFARPVYALDPDVILIDLENPSRDVLEQMFQVSRAVRRPIAMFVDQSDAASIQASVDAGRFRLHRRRVEEGAHQADSRDLCISRFNAFRNAGRALNAPNPRWKTARSSIAPKAS